MPIEAVVSSIAVRPDHIQTVLEGEQYIQRLGEVVVLHDLQGLLGDMALDPEREQLPVVIVQGKAGRIALIVSEFLGPQKLVNVPLDERVFDCPGVAGTSVFTGGRIGLTLDIEGLVAAPSAGKPLRRPPPRST